MNSIIQIIKKKLMRNKQDAIGRFIANGGVLNYGKEGVNIYNSYIDPQHAYLIEIGKNVTITNSTILAHDASIKIPLGKSRVGKVRIGSNVFIGWGSIVLPGITIGDDVVIGAGSVVTKDIPSNSVAAGNPCIVIKRYDEFVDYHKSNMKTAPTYNTYHALKTDEEKELMKIELENTIGYDE